MVFFSITDLFSSNASRLGVCFCSIFIYNAFARYFEKSGMLCYTVFMNEFNSAIFFPQAEKICREVFENISENLFVRLDIRTFDYNESPESSAFYSVVLQNQLEDELKNDKNATVISSPFLDSGKIVFFILYLTKKLMNSLSEHQILYEKISESLFDFLSEQWKSNSTYFYNGSTSSIIIRKATDSLVTEISKQCCSYNDFALYETINLSMLNILRLIRKLLELSDQKENIGIISDTNTIYGIGKPKSDENLYSVSFSKDHKWTLLKNSTELLTMKNNLLVFSNSLPSKKDFMKYAGKIFQGSEKIAEMHSIIMALCEQHKGTILVIKKDASELAQKYQDLAILTKKVKLDSENVRKLSSIDGAILMDENCICHGFGAVLDGLDSGCGNRARGSRFNSSERFYKLYRNEKDTDFMVFILSDDGNYNFFPPLEKYL